VAAARGEGVFPISRHSGQFCADSSVSQRCAEELYTDAPTSKPAASHELGRFTACLASLLPPVQIMHPYPDVRFAAKHPSILGKNCVR